MSGPSNKLQAPPSKVRVLARSRDEEDPDMGRGPMTAHVEREMCPWAISKYFGD
jgi:hypothetical protein